MLCFDYLLGNRLLKRHTEVLGVHFRIDTTEAKTQALHDLVYLSVELGVLSAVFLFMDELEKVGGLHSVSITTRYLYGIRALIDALPDNLFMMMGITPDARQRYAEMFPALSARFQQSLRLNPLRNAEEAIKLFRFYLDSARERAKRDGSVSGLEIGKDDLVYEGDARKVFDTLQAQGGQFATRPITQRAFLGSLYNLVDKKIQGMMQ
ncbi:MAG: hypothetical protein NT023_13415 [Armatimonadetes bacterium]|nr:hypothetical protein [Armatimonadota bacterium]